jgi:SRSO17 transposase
LAEAAGYAEPQAFQRFLRTAHWDHEGLRQWHEHSVYDELADDDARWDVDDTGFLKQGRHSVGVQRQYSGTAGKTANCQIAVCLAFSSYKGYAVTDYRLYLPASWTQDLARCQQAGVPDGTVFKTKPALVVEMLTEALARGYRASCVTADADYGKAPYLREFLKRNRLAFALGLQKKLQVELRAGKLRPLRGAGTLRESVQTLEGVANEVKPGDWLWLPLPGSQGPSAYEWAHQEIWLEDAAYGLLMRRLGTEVRFFLTWSPEHRDLVYWVRQIVGRWDIERCFQEAKQEVGLDEYQVRKWQAWYRHLLLAWVLVWRLSRLKLLHAHERWTLPQVRQLMRIPWLAKGSPIEHLLDWLQWRRKHNAKSAKSHRKRRHQELLDKGAS